MCFFRQLKPALSRAAVRLGNENLKGLPYAREEMCSAFVCAELGIVPTVRHSNYIAAWLDMLKENSRSIFRAASQASKAADYLLAYRAGDGEGKGAGE